MAGDLVQRLNIRHTFAHDLESFFWVLLWIFLTRVPTHYEDAFRSSFIHSTMNPKVCRGSRGPLKRIFLLSSSMLGEEEGVFQFPNNPPLGALLVAMKRTVADRYLDLPSEESIPESVKKIDPIIAALNRPDGTESDKSRDALRAAASDSQSMNHRKPLGFLKDHYIVSQLFTSALSNEWPKDDKAEFQCILPLSSEAEAGRSGSKRSRTANEIQLADQPSSKRQA